LFGRPRRRPVCTVKDFLDSRKLDLLALCFPRQSHQIRESVRRGQLCKRPDFHSRLVQRPRRPATKLPVLTAEFSPRHFQIAMPERKAVIEAAKSASHSRLRRASMPAQRDAAGNRMVATYFRRKMSTTRMIINPHFTCFAKSAIFVSVADAQAVSLPRGVCSISVATSAANQPVIGRSKYGCRLWSCSHRLR
jgi:hypothetical protein